MCGIVGCISKDTEINHLWIESMNDVQKHRGPDAKGVFLDSNVGLGHRRLSILDLSAAGNQPMFSKCGRYVIIFNGEVYNYKEIAKDLAISATSNCDTEVLVEAYAKLGTKAISLFNGMFTLAIYDKVEKSLFLARDRMGVKPLFYSFTNNILAFSSELKSILKLPFVSKEINTSCFSSYLHVGYIPEPETIYKNIFKFPASNFAEFKNGALTFTNYWNIEEKIAPVSFTNEKEVKKELKNLIESSIQYRLISDVPVGAFLSGGVDSSLITAVANKFYSSKIKTFSIGFEESKFNEAPFAKKVANHIGTEHHEFILSEKTAIDSFVKLNSIYDEPFADTSAIPTLMVSEMASKSVKIVLSGDGGDELFLGYGAHAWANRLKKPLLNSLKNPISQVCKF